MPGNPNLPRPQVRVLSKTRILEQLRAIDSSDAARKRVLQMESEFRLRITNHVTSLPKASSVFGKLNTSPFVLLFYARQRGYKHVSDIERDILPAKIFSSMETSAGRMVEDIVLPAYGWESVRSTMHSWGSVIDGRKKETNILRLATIKSGPRCLNDEMSKDIADDIVGHAEQWAEEAKVDHVEFTYGVLYGTPKSSNKKDWHILRNVVETVGTRFVIQGPEGRWDCSFRLRGMRVDVVVRIGSDWWNHLGGETTLLEILTSLIRACVIPAPKVTRQAIYTISDLSEIVSMKAVPNTYNVSVLQHSQLEWLFFLARHYCDVLTD